MNESTLVLALTDQIAQLKKEHRQRVQALRPPSSKVHGENLDLRRELARCGSICEGTALSFIRE